MGLWDRIWSTLTGRTLIGRKNEAVTFRASVPPAIRTVQGPDGEEIHLREGTFELDLLVASGELEREEAGEGGDLRHGVRHLADLLSFDPRRPEWLELAGRYATALGGDRLSVLEPGERRYFANEALRARWLAERGEVDEALAVLIAVGHAKPDVDYLSAWALDWLEPEGGVEGLSDSRLAPLFGVVLNSFPEVADQTVGRRADARRWAGLALRSKERPGLEPVAHLAIAGLLRKAGHFDEAVAHVRRQMPSWATVVAEGLALRAKGDAEGAEEAFARAAELDPHDITAFLEAGDTFFDRGDWARALGWYERVLAVEEDHPWATASAVRCRAGDAGDATAELERLREEGNPRAVGILALEAGWRGAVPRPVDASAAVLDQVLERFATEPPKEGSSLRISVSDVEAPSNRVAFTLAFALDLQVEVQNVASPDPRRPIEDTGLRVWRLDDAGVVVPASDPPSPEVVARIAALASEPYRPGRHWAAASRIAADLGPERVDELLSCVANPPPLPDGEHALDWIPRVHRCVASVLAHVDGGWHDSVRRRALRTLLLGPMDWSTEAAIATLASLVAEDRTLFTDVHEAFGTLEASRPDSGHCCWGAALYHYWRQLPLLFPGERDELEGKYRAAIE